MKAAAAIVGMFLVGWLCFQRHTISQLRAETGLLTQNQAEVELPKGDATQIPTNADPAVEIAKLKEETRDLPKLRNEGRQLREQKQLIERLKTENESLRTHGQPTTPQMVVLPNIPGLLSRESLTNAGLSTPEAAVQTYFWALREKDQGIRATCFTPHFMLQLQEPNGAEGFQAREDEKTKAIAFRLIGQQAEEPDVMRVHLRLWMGGLGVSDGRVPVTQSSIRLRKIAGEWKVDEL